MITTKFKDSPYLLYAPYEALEEYKNLVVTASHDEMIDYNDHSEWRNMFSFKIDDEKWRNNGAFNGSYNQDAYPPGKRLLYVNMLGFDVNVIEMDGSVHCVPNITSRSELLRKYSQWAPSHNLVAEPGKFLVLTLSHNSEHLRKREIKYLMNTYKSCHRRYGENEIKALFTTMHSAKSAYEHYGLEFEKLENKNIYDSGIKEVYSKFVIASIEDFDGKSEDGEIYCRDTVFDITTGLLVSRKQLGEMPSHPNSSMGRILGGLLVPDYEDYSVRVELVATKGKVNDKYINLFGRIGKILPKDPIHCAKEEGLYIYSVTRDQKTGSKFVRTQYYSLEDMLSQAPVFDTIEQARKGKDLEIERLTDKVQSLTDKLQKQAEARQQADEIHKVQMARKDEELKRMLDELKRIKNSFDLDKELAQRELKIEKFKLSSLITEKIFGLMKFISNILITVKSMVPL